MGKSNINKVGIKKENRLFDIFNIIVNIIIAAVMIYPLLLVVSLSLSDPSAVMAGKVKLYPVGFDLNSYVYVLRDDSLLRAYVNTICYTILGVALTLLFTSMTAYPLSMKKFKARRFFNVFIIIPMFISGGLIPYYMVYQKLGMIDTVWAIVLPCVSTWNVIILRQFFTQCESLHEAANIDGANNWAILFRIVIPLSKASLAAIALFTGVAIWNDFYRALLFLNRVEMHPLQMYLRKIIVDLDMNENTEFVLGASVFVVTRSIKSASIIVSLLPILFLYPFLQKYFVKGVFMGSLKG